MRPLAGSSESPASSLCALQPVVTKQGRKLYKNMALKVTTQRKFKLSLGSGLWSYLAARQIQTFWLGETCLTLQGKIVILVFKKKKYYFLHIILLMKIEHNIVILFTHFLVKKKQKNAQKIRFVSPSSVTVFIFWWLSAFDDTDVCIYPFVLL